MTRVLINPKLYFGEAIMDGTMTWDGGDLHELLDLVAQNLVYLEAHPSQAWRAQLGPLARLRAS